MDEQEYGIDKAIELMRTLPHENVELVVQVVKFTLESAKIKIGSIIDDATGRQDDIQGRIKILKSEIADYETEIAQRREEIAKLDADFRETSMVKDRLQLAERLSKKPGTAAAATVSSESTASTASTASTSIGDDGWSGERQHRSTGPLPTLSGSPAAAKPAVTVSTAPAGSPSSASAGSSVSGPAVSAPAPATSAPPASASPGSPGAAKPPVTVKK